MLSYLDKDGTYALPTGWHEVTTRQYLDLDRLKLATVEARASYFAGRPIQVNVGVAGTLAFLLYEPPTGQIGSTYPFDLGQETFLQVETIRAALVAQPLHECYGLVYGTFTARMRNYNLPEFSQKMAARLAADCMAEHPPGSFGHSIWMITETYPAVKHCLNELARLSEKYAYLAEPDRTEAGQKARAAGSDRLDKYGHFNVAYAYSQKLGVSLEAVYQMSWETITIMLMHDKEVAEIQDLLQRNNLQSGS